MVHTEPTSKMSKILLTLTLVTLLCGFPHSDGASISNYSNNGNTVKNHQIALSNVTDNSNKMKNSSSNNIADKNNKMTGSNNKVTGSNNKMTGSNNKVTSSNNKVTSSNNKLTYSKKNVTDTNDNVTNKSEAFIGKQKPSVQKGSGAPISNMATQKVPQQGSGSHLLKSGTRTVVLESQSGFNGVSSYKPSGWKITETVSSSNDDKNSEEANQNQPVFTYPLGLGPVLLNGCTGTKYDKTSACYNSKLFNLQGTLCAKQMGAANYIGVGFDGRGRYRSESRKASLIQRSCANRATFMNKDVPDTMNVLGIFETRAETKSFQSVDEYMKYIRHKAGLSKQKNLLVRESRQYSKSTKKSSSGSKTTTEMSTSSSRKERTDQSSGRRGSTQNFFAIMYVNVILYEITLDEVKPTDMSLAALKDYMSLPVSYYSIGADVKYQNFLLRWGTHYVRSAKFGGQLKVTKTAKAGKFQSEQEFAGYAQNEFQAMFSTLQYKWSQKSRRTGFFGLGGTKTETSQSSSGKSESSSSSTMNENQQRSSNMGQSQFTQTNVEAQGGKPDIAEALVDFYTPAFKQNFHEWLGSIKDFTKPFEFQLRPINDLFNFNMESLFPSGKMNFGCLGGRSGKVKIEVDPKSKQRFYIDTVTSLNNNVTTTTRVRVNCKYSSIGDFKDDIQRRRISLERAVGVYMIEGPFPTTSFELQAGEPGCEEATRAQFRLFGNLSVPLKFAELLRHPFLMVFNLPEGVPGIVSSEAKYVMVFRLNRWFAVEPKQQLLNLYDGCQVANAKPTDKKVCFRNIVFTYEESTGLFDIERADYVAAKQRLGTLPYWLAGMAVARSRRLPSSSLSGSSSARGVIPCNLKWLNSHRLDPVKNESCIHFTAATAGDLFVVFASVPKDHSTWYYLQIGTEGVGFYSAMRQQKYDRNKGIGMLGDNSLFQSFFVCVTQKSGRVTMQYGKVDPDSKAGTVHSSYTFRSDSHFSRLSFYSFGAGIKPVSLMDIRMTRKLPEVICLSRDYVKKDGHCALVCHSECDGCQHARDNKACQQCKNVRVETGSGAARVVECMAQCPAAMQLSKSMEGLCVPAKNRA